MVSRIVSGDEKIEVVIRHDPFSQDAYLIVTTYIAIMGEPALRRIWKRGPAVYEVQPWRQGQHGKVQIVAEAKMTLNLAGDGNAARYVEVKMNVIEDRNNSGMDILQCSVPRLISDEYENSFRSQRRWDPDSTAYYARSSGEVICRNIIRSSASSKDDSDGGGASSRHAAPGHPRSNSIQQLQRPQNGRRGAPRDSP